MHAYLLLSLLLHAALLLAYRNSVPANVLLAENRPASALRLSFRAPLAAKLQAQAVTRTASRRTPDAIASSAAPRRLLTLPAATPATGSDDASPHLDLDAVRNMARESGRSAYPRPAPAANALATPAGENDTPLARAIGKAARPDCRTAHADAGLLALAYLAKDALLDKGCKW